ncbi:MAG: prolyl oligopeptidase family serine peptidase [Candidatus Hodarchaeales archaeon]|jgi:prolyl oligopeptidase
MNPPTLEYPPTKQISVKTTLHNTVIEDHYSWLENTSDPEVQEWIKAQNSFTESILGHYSGRISIEERLRELASHDDITRFYELKIKSMENNDLRFFFLFREAEEPQAKLYYQDGEDGERIELLNPLDLSSEGLATIDWFHPSPNGEYVAYGISLDGTELSTLYVLDVKSKTNLTEEIPQTRACSLAWFSDSAAFYYTRYPLPGTVSPEDEKYHRHVFYHELGTDFQQDVKVWGEERIPTEWPSIELSKDGRFLLLTGDRFTETDVFVAQVPEDSRTRLEFLPVIEKKLGRNNPQLAKGKLYNHTQVDISKGAIYEYDLEEFFSNEESRAGRLLIPPSEDEVISDFVVTSGFLAVIKNKNASSRLHICHLESGNILQKVEFETLVTLERIVAAGDVSQVFFAMASFFSPAGFYSCKLNESPKAFLKPTVAFDEVDFTVKQVWYPSKDGTRVSMFILSKTGLVPSAKTPIFLAGYGGFNISLTPDYNMFMSHIWIEQGGVVAIPNLRGGNEYGEAWHHAGMRERKQNVFDDFIAAGEWLIDNGYGSQETLAIFGGSNGGLLVGAALVQRPDLFGAVGCFVPLLDMIRYTRFLIAKLWTPEYGDPQKPEEFQWLYAYSPYHHVKKGVTYPPVYFHTADGDSRVDPMHACKMAAKLQELTRSETQPNPFLLWVETQAGHGIGMPLEKRVQVYASTYLFLAHHTGLNVQ